MAEISDEHTYRPLLKRNDFVEGMGHNSVWFEDGKHYIVYHGRDLTDADAGVDTRCARIDEMRVDGGRLAVTPTPDAALRKEKFPCSRTQATLLFPGRNRAAGLAEAPAAHPGGRNERPSGQDLADVRDSRWIGGDRDGWERVPYWLDGFVPWLTSPGRRPDCPGEILH
jgi:hypothetical protein